MMEVLIICGRYTTLTEDEIIEIREILKDLSLRIVKDEFEQFEGENELKEVRPTDSAPVITENTDGISFEKLKWGFRRFNSSGVIINARVETIKIKSTFSKHLKGGRCIVPAGEFFEWHRIGKEKKKHYAKDREGKLLFMAGLYLNKADDGEPENHREFVIITKEATGDMKKIHDRMPVILSVDQIEDWLSGKMSPDDLEKLEYDVKVVPCEVENEKAEQFTFF